MALEPVAVVLRHPISLYTPPLQENLRRKRAREEEGSDEDLDDFVVDDEEADWRNALKSITGYDPSK